MLLEYITGLQAPAIDTLVNKMPGFKKRTYVEIPASHCLTQSIKTQIFACPVPVCLVRTTLLNF